MNVKQFVNQEYQILLADLKTGDEIIISGSYDRPLKMSKKTSDARLKVIELVRQKLINKEITTDEANQITNQFGRKTSDLFWCRKAAQ